MTLNLFTPKIISPRGGKLELNSIELRNFKCFKDSGKIPIHRMTIFIGENDSGKSSILKALKIFFSFKGFTKDCFHQINEVMENSASIEISLKIDENDSKLVPKHIVVNNSITVKQEFTLKDGNIELRSLVFSNAYSDDRLNNLKDSNALELKELCELFHIKYTTKDDSKIKISDYLAQNDSGISKKTQWTQVKWGEISPLLPIYENYDSSNYGNPLVQVDNTLNSIYQSYFYNDDGNGNVTLREELKVKEYQIRSDLNSHIQNELKKKINDKVDKIVSISGDFSIDFSSGFSLKDLIVDLGDGPRSINNIGEGSKKRLLLALLEWDCELRAKGSKRVVIRGYDEPDANLHYEAQKKMFYALNKSSNPVNNVQVLICTHSISMVDRAPANSINRIIHQNGCSKLDYLIGCEESEIKDFLDNLASISGIKNSSFFFERCFLIVEGETEQNALPIIHKKITNKHMVESGIVLINLKSNACWKEFLMLLNKNKSGATILFLDNDIQSDGSKKITLKKIEEIGFRPEFLENNVILVGSKEFEDIFSNDEISRCLNLKWPKDDGSIWTQEEIEQLRPEKKFSKALYDAVHLKCSIRFGKPEFGKAIAELLTRDELISKDKIKKYIDTANVITS